MRRATWIFLAAILLPSLGLAWLAIHSAQDQQIVLQHQQAIIDQEITDSLAQKVSNQMDEVLGEFVETTKQMLAQTNSPEILANGFDPKLRGQWPLAQVGFAVDLQGRIYSPNRGGDEQARHFPPKSRSSPKSTRSKPRTISLS